MHRIGCVSAREAAVNFLLESESHWVLIVADSPPKVPSPAVMSADITRCPHHHHHKPQVKEEKGGSIIPGMRNTGEKKFILILLLPLSRREQQAYTNFINIIKIPQGQ